MLRHNLFNNKIHSNFLVLHRKKKNLQTPIIKCKLKARIITKR